MVTLRPLSDNDVVAINKITEGNTNGFGIPNVGATIGKLLEGKNTQSDVHFFCIVVGNEIVGIRYLKPQDDGVETGVWILPAHRRNGYATDSLRVLIYILKTEFACVGYRKALIYVDIEKNPYACKPALQCRFTEVGVAESINGSTFSIFALSLD